MSTGHGAGGGSGEVRTDTFLIYDAETGAVVHGHQVMTLPYGDAAPPEELERQALAVAAEATGRPVEALRVTAVSEGDVEPGHHYRVDPASGRLQRHDGAESA